MNQYLDKQLLVVQAILILRHPNTHQFSFQDQHNLAELLDVFQNINIKSATRRKEIERNKH